MTNNAMQFDEKRGWIPAVPLPYYCWQFWKWQQVMCCECGEKFISRDLHLSPKEYVEHYTTKHQTESSR